MRGNLEGMEISQSEIDEIIDQMQLYWNNGMERYNNRTKRI